MLSAGGTRIQRIVGACALYQSSKRMTSFLLTAHWQCRESRSPSTSSWSRRSFCHGWLQSDSNMIRKVLWVFAICASSENLKCSYGLRWNYQLKSRWALSNEQRVDAQLNSARQVTVTTCHVESHARQLVPRTCPVRLSRRTLQVLLCTEIL